MGFDQCIVAQYTITGVLVHNQLENPGGAYTDPDGLVPVQVWASSPAG
jgi:hypothetical protein